MQEHLLLDLDVVVVAMAQPALTRQVRLLLHGCLVVKEEAWYSIHSPIA